MNYEQLNLPQITGASLEEVAVFIIVLTLLLLIVVAVRIQDRKRRREQEIPFFAELMADPVMLDFFSLLTSSEQKLKLYRSFYNLTHVLDTFHIILKNEIQCKRKTGLAKLLSHQVEHARHILYDPEITHLLYDTEETKISQQGMEMLQSFKEQFRKHLFIYGKLLRHNRSLAIFNTAPVYPGALSVSRFQSLLP